MQPDFWLESWQLGGTKTSFHRPDFHPYVRAYTPDYFLRGQRVLVPLCGKDNALMWYRDRAEHVIGIELAEAAIKQFFQEQNLPYRKTTGGRYIIDHIEQPELPEHRMVQKFNLDFLKEHGFFLTKIAAKKTRRIFDMLPLATTAN
jgi:hypothetical protein